MLWGYLVYDLISGLLCVKCDVALAYVRNYRTMS